MEVKLKYIEGYGIAVNFGGSKGVLDDRESIAIIGLFNDTESAKISINYAEGTFSVEDITEQDTKLFGKTLINPDSSNGEIIFTFSSDVNYILSYQ